VLDTIGNTPLLDLRRISEAEGVDATILGKLEYFNPSGSLKDRIYKEMIGKAVERGDLKPGMEILEASTGNAGIACAFVGRATGFKVTVVLPEGMSDERKKMIGAFGGQLVLTPGGESDVDLCLKKVHEMMRGNQRYWFPNQFENPDNPGSHYKTTGPEIFRQTSGRVDAFVAAQGSGGTLTGVGRYLRRRKKGTVLFAAEPAEAPTISESRWGSHRIEGIGDGFVPKNLDLSLLDGVATVSSEEAVGMAKGLLEEEGVFCGISSGCNVAAAVKVAKAHPELKTIVTMINDSGNRYFSTELFGVKKALRIPKRDHPLDPYSVAQLKKYRSGLEVVH